MQFFDSNQPPVGAELEASRSMPTSALFAPFGPETRTDVGIRPYGLWRTMCAATEPAPKGGRGHPPLR